MLQKNSFEDESAKDLQQNTQFIQQNDIFEEFINLLDVLSLEPFPWKLLKNTIPIVDKNFPPGSRLIQLRRQEFTLNTLNGVKSRWMPLDNKLLIWIAYQQTQLLKAGMAKLPHDILQLEQSSWISIAGILGLSLECVVNQWSILCPTFYKDRDWLPLEDELILYLLNQNQEVRKSWKMISEQIFKQTARYRYPKQIRGRWHNHLNPEIKKCEWNYEEDQQLVQLVNAHGKRWSLISRTIGGRTENMVKNQYNSMMRKLQKRARSSISTDNMYDQLLQSQQSSDMALQTATAKYDQTFSFNNDSNNNDGNQQISLCSPHTITNSIQRLEEENKEILLSLCSNRQEVAFPGILVQKLDSSINQPSEDNFQLELKENQMLITQKLNISPVQQYSSEIAFNNALTFKNASTVQIGLQSDLQQKQQHSITIQNTTNHMPSLAINQSNLHMFKKIVQLQEQVETNPLLLQGRKLIETPKASLHEPFYYPEVLFTNNRFSYGEDSLFQNELFVGNDQDICEEDSL